MATEAPEIVSLGMEVPLEKGVLEEFNVPALSSPPSERTHSAYSSSSHTSNTSYSSISSFEVMPSQSVEQKMSQTWTAKSETTIRGPYDYIAAVPGKEIRRQLMQALNVWYKVDERQSQIIADTVATLHTASLLIDDIQDGSKLRRGVPCAHEIYGIAQTINSANYMYFCAQQNLQQLPNWPEAFRIFNEEVSNLHRGQGMELYWRDTIQPPSESEYLQMISNKTGGLFRLMERLLRSCSPRKDIDVSRLVQVMGLQFQILDDYKNLSDEKMISQKGFFEDLSEGKFSYPIAHAMWIDCEQKDQIINVLRQKTEDMAVKTHIARCLEECGSMAQTRKAILELAESAQTLLREVEDNPLIAALLAKMTDKL